MNRTVTTVALQSVFAAAVIAAAPLASAFPAGQSSYAAPGADHVLVSKPFVSTLSREEVRAGAVAEAREPLTFTDSQNRPERDEFVSMKSRDQVRAEAIAANRINGVGPFTDSQHRPLTPAQAEQIRSAGLRVNGGDTMAAAQR